MSTETLLLVIFAALIALGLSAWMYFLSRKKSTKHALWYGIFRFLVLFSVFLLLINPTFKQTQYRIDKPELVLAIDNSSSMAELEQSEIQEALVIQIDTDQEIAERFNLKKHLFDAALTDDQSLGHGGSQTNIRSALQSLHQIYDTAPVLLLTDGNQTFGGDYSHYRKRDGNPVFPIIFGDSIKHQDLRVSRVNTNTYAFLNNKFPVEVIINYEGDTPVDTKFTITKQGRTVFSKNVSLSPENNAQLIEAVIEADRTGLQKLTATVAPTSIEKNTSNNQRSFAIEVIDQQTKVALVTNIVHPDIGALQKSIAANEQRSFEVIDPSVKAVDLAEYQVIVLYQPNNTFQDILQKISAAKASVFMIVGPNSDLSFLNNNQDFFKQQVTNETDNAIPYYNTAYGDFIVDDIGFELLPPLVSEFGDVIVGIPHQTLLYKKISNVETKEPLMVTFEQEQQRGVILFGEGIWRWRMQDYLKNNNFSGFDRFFGKLVQFLSSGAQTRERLRLDHESFYYGNDDLFITAQYFDKNYIFDSNKRLNITITNIADGTKQEFPFLLKNNSYQVDLSNLEAGQYRFTVKPEGERITQSGSFEIIPFDAEKQFLNADISRLRRLADNTGGQAYFPSDFDALKAHLLTENRFAPVQRAEENIVPLIDWKWLLGIVALCLSAEWFLRKYNGLI